jgi:hypothetical protein
MRKNHVPRIGLRQEPKKPRGKVQKKATPRKPEIKEEEDTVPKDTENTREQPHALANHSTTRERAGRTGRRPWSRDLRSTAPQPDDLPQPPMLFFLKVYYFLYLNLIC